MPSLCAAWRTLRACGVLAVVFPEIDRLYGTPQRAEFHPEIDAGIHQEMVSDMAARIAPGDALVGWCALVHDLGKGITPREQLPRHDGHETTGLPLVQALYDKGLPIGTLLAFMMAVVALSLP